MNSPIPLVTKYWEVDHGTLKSLPNNGFIEKVIRDLDGIFIFECQSKNGNLYWSLRNPPDDFDYTITVFGSHVDDKTQLNSSLYVSAKELFHWQNMHLFVNQKFKVAYNFFFYKNLGTNIRQKMRNFVQQQYNYIRNEISVIPTSSITTAAIQSLAITIGNDAIPEISSSSVCQSETVSLPKIIVSNVLLPSPYEYNIVFYVNSFNPTLSSAPSKSTLITPKDMVKTFKLPNGIKATICNMKYFMEESIYKFNFDKEALKLYAKFKSIDDHQICTACPPGHEITECNVWQMNANGYYLCTSCCLSLARLDGQHNCHVPTVKTQKSRWCSSYCKGFCSRCLFYFKPCKTTHPITIKRTTRHRDGLKNIKYKAADFFEILISENKHYQIPDFSDWETPTSKEQQKLAETQPKIEPKKTLDAPKMSDIITIKDSKNEENELKVKEEKEKMEKKLKIIQACHDDAAAQNVEETPANSESDIDDLQESFAKVVAIKDVPELSTDENFLESQKNDEKEEETSEIEEGWEIADNVSETAFENDIIV